MDFVVAVIPSEAETIESAAPSEAASSIDSFALDLRLFEARRFPRALEEEACGLASFARSSITRSSKDCVKGKDPGGLEEGAVFCLGTGSAEVTVCTADTVRLRFRVLLVLALTEEEAAVDSSSAVVLTAKG